MEDKSKHEKIYDKISVLFDLKFKAQLKGAPITFESFLYVKDIVSGNDFYILLLKNEATSLEFVDKASFVSRFISFIDNKLAELEEEFDALVEFEKNSRHFKYDENEVYMNHERIGHHSTKLNQLKTKLGQ